MRFITQQTLLYSEMVTTGAVINGDREYLLGYGEQEHPIALQLGGSNPADLAQASLIGQDYGYDEINLNVGCPSSRVQSGMFGACLMKQPALVADCVDTMQQAVQIPVTVKTRIGVDDQDSYELLVSFIETVAKTGCQTFIIHARKAWLQGLSPKENRDVPPLHYDVVYQLKKDFPDLELIINGGIKTLADVKTHLAHVDGVMIGREAYSNPYLFANVDQQFFAISDEARSQKDVIQAYLPYVSEQLCLGVRLRPLIRPLIGMFQGMPGARAWRRYLSENGGRDDIDVIDRALELVKPLEVVLD